MPSTTDAAVVKSKKSKAGTKPPKKTVDKQSKRAKPSDASKKSGGKKSKASSSKRARSRDDEQPELANDDDDDEEESAEPTTGAGEDDDDVAVVNDDDANDDDEDDEDGATAEETEADAAKKAARKEKREKKAKARRGALTRARGYRALAVKSGAAVHARNVARTITTRAIVKRAATFLPGTVEKKRKQSDPTVHAVAYADANEFKKRLRNRENPPSDSCADAALPYFETLMRQLAANTMERAYDAGAMRPSPVHLHAACRSVDAALGFTTGIPRGLLRLGQKTTVTMGKGDDKVEVPALSVGPADDRQMAAEEGEVIPAQLRYLEDHEKRLAARKAERAATAAKRKEDRAAKAVAA